jgi:D-alanyl-D-alanine carboxypeptidase (penicillin-binding protein 5/6)
VACKLESFRAKAVAVAALAAALLAAPAALGQEPSAPPKVTAASVYVLNADTGKPLYSKNEHKPARLHSLTKLVTAYVAMQRPGDRLSETVTIEPKHLTTGSSAGLRKGDVWTLQNLLYGMLLVSGNDAALAIADTTGRAILEEEGKRGDPLRRFVIAMDDAASDLGAVGARFADPSGLSPTNIATARAVARLGAAIFGDERLQPIWACKRRVLSIAGPAAREATLDSTVEILGEDGIVGAKTGSHISKNIYNLAAAWRAPNGDLIVAATLGSANHNARYKDMRTIVAALPRDFPELAVPDPGRATVVAACLELPQRKPAGSAP